MGVKISAEEFMREWAICVVGLAIVILAGAAKGDEFNLVKNPDFKIRTEDGRAPADYQLNGDVEYRYLGDPNRDSAQWGVALQSTGSAGSVSQTVTGIDASRGRWYRFSFRGLPQDNFAVGDEDLSMRVEFFGDWGKTAYDGKSRKIFSAIEEARQDLSVNGDNHRSGAAVWRMYQLDFWVPFVQVDTLRLSVVFGHGAASRAIASEFFITDFSLTRLEDSPAGEAKTSGPSPSINELYPKGTLLPLGGRWYYEAKEGQTQPPAIFDHTNAERLLYHDAKWQAPFAGNMTSWLRAGDKDRNGMIALADKFVPDNVTVEFDGDTMIIHTKGLPNHPTGKFPEMEGSWRNPNFITEHDRTYFIPLNPKVNPRHIFTARDNSNHALPMGPIGIAVNGVVFFNPFDAQSQDATNMMDRCCGHPAPDGTYHYHKYPICVNSPWSDEGKEHSPLIGWAFDGFPIYGPFESAGVMAKDLTGDNALNDFNLHWDKDRGWHYHVTPGQFPYIIGGYWGTEDSRDRMSGRGGLGGGRPGGGFGPPPDGGMRGFGPPPGF
jgi:hypothetical protein